MPITVTRRSVLAGTVGAGLAIPLARQARPLNAPRTPVGFGVTGGTRLLPAATPISALSGFSLAGGATVQLYAGPISGASYMLDLDGLNASGATSAKPFSKVSLIWKNGPLGSILALQHWFALQTNVSPASGNSLITGRGPAESGYLQALLKNEDPSNSVSVDTVLYQSSKTALRHDLRSASNNVSGQYSGTWLGSVGPASTPDSDPAALILGCSPSITVNAGTFASRINALFAGQAQLSVQTASGISVSLYAADPDLSAATLQPLYAGIVPASGQLVIQNISVPRMPTVVVFTNSGGAATNVAYSLVAQEFAS